MFPFIIFNINNNNNNNNISNIAGPIIPQQYTKYVGYLNHLVIVINFVFAQSDSIKRQALYFESHRHPI